MDTDAEMKVFNSMLDIDGLNDISDFSKSTSISGAGAYVAPIVGLDRIELTVSGSGKIYLKELVG